MMKKILFTLMLLLSCMTAAWAGTGDGSQADDATIEVGDWETLKETIQNDNAAKIRLTDDIVFRGLFDFLCTDFKGEIHGQGHTISGSFLPLFESMTDATIENITFKDFQVYSDKLQVLGGIAMTATGCTLHDITLDNCYVENHRDGGHNDSNFTGALVGALYSCKGNVENVIVKNSTIISYDERIGAIAGWAENTQFVHCEVDDRTGVFGDGAPLKIGTLQAMVGGFVGSSSGCIYEECINSALVAGDSEQIGGIIGHTSNDKILNCVNTGLVMGLDDDDFYAFLPQYRQKEFVKCKFKYNGKTYISQFLNDAEAKKATSEMYVGGIVGYQSNSEINQCTNYGEVCSDGTAVGGIVGYVGRGSIYNCLSAGPVVYDNYYVGTIVGNHFSGEMRNCFALTDDHKMCGDDTGNCHHHFCFTTKDYSRDVSDGELAVTSKEMKSGLVARYLNDYNTTGATPWRQNLTAHDDIEVDLFPTLDPTHDEVTFEAMTSRTAITNAAQLIAFAKQVNEGEKDQFACAHLEADIDLSEVENWTPIGSNASYSQYRGCFDGRGHTIKNLKVSGSAAAGLFGAAHVGAEIRNLIIGDGSTITSSGDAGAGGILGQVNVNWNWGYVRIENCGSYADINVNKHGGGILGKVEMVSDNDFRVNVINSWSMGTITAENGNSGLLCGYTKNHGRISNCWSGGQLRNGKNKGIWPYSIENDPNNTVAEYLVGYDKNLEIENCYVADPDANIDRYGEKPTQAGVETTGEESLASGEITYKLNGSTNDVTKSLTWQQNLGTDTIPVFGSNGIYHTRDISKKDYGTICVPYPLESLKGVGRDSRDYYVFKEAKDEADGTMSLCFEYVDVVPAGTPALFTAIVNGTYEFFSAGDEFNFEAQAAAGIDWTFKGTYKQLKFEGDAAKTIYYVDGTGESSAIKNAKKTTIAPFRAYFEGPSIEELTGSGKARISIVIDGEEDETSALELVYDYENHNENDNRSYTLFGTEAGEGYRGIVVRGGKKIINEN